ncbi:hypothetical protein [Methanococcoides sp. FTZ1]|uniref:hypothetical protein n=1 Tax=Methanococcoides sp. FTZ1 TaxID=3439061 RepID=UPI003F87C808
MKDRKLPGDEITYHELAELIIEKPPQQGDLTISNALQWRIQYGRIVSMDSIDGVEKII